MLSKEQRERLKIIGKYGLLIAIVLFTARFFLWNHWRLEQNKTMLKQIRKAPAAVNLVITDSADKKTLFSGGFPANKTGNYYFIFPFDISPYLSKTGGPRCQFTVNGYLESSPKILYHRRCFIVLARGRFFVFPRPPGHVPKFVRLRKSFPVILDKVMKYFPSYKKNVRANVAE